MLDRPRPSRPPAAGLHLVGYVEDPVPLADQLQGLDEVGGHRDEAALALDGLEHDAGDRVWIDVLREEQLEAGDRLRGRDAAVRVWSGRAVDVRRERAEDLLVDRLPGTPHSQD